MKYIKYDRNFRCRIRFVRYMNSFELQIQKRFFIFWYNVYHSVTVQEGFWGERAEHPILTDTYMSGDVHESYMTGTLDIPKRVSKLFIEFFEYNKKRNLSEQYLKTLS